MAIVVSLNGAPYTIPEVGDSNWAAGLTLYLQALATAFPQTNTGSTGFGCYAEATSTAGQTVTNNASTVIIFGTEITDTDNAYNPATGVFTVPSGKTGRYLVSAVANVGPTGLVANTGAFTMSIYKNGVEVVQDVACNALNSVSGVGLRVRDTINATAGDTIDIRVFQNNGGNRTLSTAAVNTRLTIERVP